MLIIVILILMCDNIMCNINNGNNNECVSV